jgi:transcriptional regulator with XRE-family HTH domain
MNRHQLNTVLTQWIASDPVHNTFTRLAKESGVHTSTLRNYLAGRTSICLVNLEAILNTIGYRLDIVKEVA